VRETTEGIRGWLGRNRRLCAAAEVVVAAAIVIGHNVYHVVPNEVPILAALLWISLLVRREGWASVGLSAPGSWKKTFALAVLAATLLLLKDLVTEPLAHAIWHQHENVSTVLTSAARHNTFAALKSLVIVWTFAAFGEELAYRGLLLRRLADALNGSRQAYLVAALFSSLLFGLGHFYKGPTGVFDSTFSGLILAGAYLLNRRNLWAPIFAHGIADTVAVVVTWLSG
jgi:uncharacterized protein